MDIEKIKIAIDTGDLQRAKDMLDQTSDKAKKTDNAVSGLSNRFFDLKSAIAGVTLLQISKQFIDTADSMNLLDSRLKMTAKSMQEYTSQQSALTNIAKGSYTSINDTLTLYTKLSPALTQVGATTAQVNNVVSIFQKGLQLGGAKAQEASSAILQFSQAMGSGVLRGEEFNAIAEASPKLLSYLAQGLEVPQTALRKMAENGELTATKVSNALLKVKSSVDNDFAQMPVTVGKAMTNLQTDLSLAVREIDKTTGATNLLANELVSFSNNIDGYTKSIIAFYTETRKYINENNQAVSITTELVKTGVEAYAGYKIIETVMGKGTTAIATIRAAMIAFSPTTAAVALAGTALFNTWIEGKERADNLGKSVDELAKSFQKLEIQKKLIDINKELAEMDKRMQGYSDEYKLTSGIGSAYNMAYKEKQKWESALDILDNKKKSIKQLFEGIDTDGLIKNQVVEFSKLSPELQKIIDPARQVREHFAALRKQLVEDKNDTPQALSNLAKAETEALEQITKKASKSQEELKKKNEEIAKAYQDIAKEGMSDYDKKLYDISLKTADFITLTGDITTGLSQQEKAVAKLNEEESKKNIEKRNADIDKQLKSSKDLFELKEKQTGLIDDEVEKNQTLTRLYYDRRKEEIKALYDKQEITYTMYEEQLKYEEQLRDKTLFRYSATGQIIESVSSGMKSSMMDFFDYTSAGFGNLKKLTIDLGNMIYKAVVQQMVVNPLVGAAQSAATSFFSTPDKKWEGGISNGQGFSKFASGYIAGNTYASYDSLSNDTIPALISPGEAVIPASVVNENRGLIGALINSRTHKFADGYIANKTTTINNNTNSSNGVVKVEVINQTTGEVQVTNTSTRQDAEGLILSVVINGVQNNKMGLRNIIQGR